MSIRFDCDTCGKDLVVHDRFEGRAVRCPSCDTNLSVPTRSQLEEARQRELEEERSRQAAEEARLRKAKQREAARLAALQDDVAVETVAIVPEPDGKPRRRKIKEDHGHEEEDLEWDITPMVDVAFLLLIFFMLTASFSIQKVIRTAPQRSDQPSSSAQQTQQDEQVDNITLQVDEFNTYTIISTDGATQEASSRQELISILKELRLQFGDTAPRVNIQAHEDSMHGAVVAAMDAAREADYSKFQIFAVENFD